MTARGNERRALFRDDADREEYLRRIARYRDKFRFRLLSFRAALHLGRDDPAFVRPLARLERSLETDPATRARVNRLLEALTPPPGPTLPPPPSSQHNQD